jgi:hypothetical protein
MILSQNIKHSLLDFDHDFYEPTASLRFTSFHLSDIFSLDLFTTTSRNSLHRRITIGLAVHQTTGSARRFLAIGDLHVG